MVKKIKYGDFISPMINYKDIFEGDTKWYLPKSSINLVYKKRKKVPQELIDLMNGKKVKLQIDTKDWKFIIGHSE